MFSIFKEVFLWLIVFVAAAVVVAAVVVVVVSVLFSPVGLVSVCEAARMRVMY